MQRATESLDVRMWLYLGTFAFLLYLVSGASPPRIDAYTPLAEAFLDGRLYLLRDEPGALAELIPRAPGEWYVPYPPGPAVLLMPIVAVMGIRFDIGLVGAFLGALSAVLMHASLRSMGVRWGTANWLAFGFAFGSVLWWAAAKSDVWLYAHLNAVCFSTAALLLALNKRWPLLAGALFGMAAVSRLPVGLTLPLLLGLYGHWHIPAVETWRGRLSALGSRLRLDLRRLAPWPSPVVRQPLFFLVGLAVPVGLVAIYNIARFNSPLDFGYARIPGVLEERWYSEGILHWSYIPRHLHVMFLQGFQWSYDFPHFKPSWTGLSLVLTTPVYLWLLKAHSREPLILFGWLAVGLAMIPIVTHGNWGWTQFGYRFSLDVSPILWLMLGWVFRERMSRYAKLAILVGIAVNAYGVWVINKLDFVSF